MQTGFDFTFLVNNGGVLRMFQEQTDGPVLVYREPDGEQFMIYPGDMVMLLNYYRACKDGLEQSDYIAADKRK